MKEFINHEEYLKLLGSLAFFVAGLTAIAFSKQISWCNLLAPQLSFAV